MYMASKTYARHKGNQVPDDIRVESLSGYQTGELSRLKSWIYRQRTKIRQERDRAERRERKKDEAAQRRTEQPALFDF